MSLRHFLRRPRAVTAAEARTLMADGALVVDVRRNFEWQRTHIPDSLHIPLDQLEQRCAELPEDRLLITFCTGGIRSAGAANLLTDNGFDAVNMTLGLIDWRAIGGPLTPQTRRGLD